MHTIIPNLAINSSEYESFCLLLKLKPGVGRMVVESDAPPIVLPYYHMGMDVMLPSNNYRPKLWKKVCVMCVEKGMCDMCGKRYV